MFGPAPRLRTRDRRGDRARNVRGALIRPRRLTRISPACARQRLAGARSRPEYQPLAIFAKSFHRGLPWPDADALAPPRAARRPFADGSRASPVSRRCVGSVAWRLRHRALRVAHEHSHAAGGARAVSGEQRELRVLGLLDAGTAGDAPREQRLQSAAGRLAGEWDGERADAGIAGLPARRTWRGTSR